MSFALGEDGFRWLGCVDATVDDVLYGMARAESKTSQMESALRELLEDGGIPSDELTAYAESLGISERTLKIAKKNIGVVSERRGAAGGAGSTGKGGSAERGSFRTASGSGRYGAASDAWGYAL